MADEPSEEEKLAADRAYNQWKQSADFSLASSRYTELVRRQMLDASLRGMGVYEEPRNLTGGQEI